MTKPWRNITTIWSDKKNCVFVFISVNLTGDSTVDNATMTSNIPDEAFQLRTSVPAHVHPTPEWTAFTKELEESGKLIDKLDDPSHYDPEIVFFSSDLTKYTDTAEFRVDLGNGHNFLTTYKTAELPIVTRWILYNGDQQVNAFALPGTCTPEGQLAAKTPALLSHSSRKKNVTSTLLLV